MLKFTPAAVKAFLVNTFTARQVFTADVDMTNLPTSDPLVAGRLWNDAGTVKVSSGS